MCKECILAKKKKISFPRNNISTIEKFEIIHIELSGPSRTRGLYDESYFMFFVDDFTRIMWVAFIKEKYESFENFKIFKNRVENESSVNIK